MGSTNNGQNGVGNLTDDVMIMSDNAYIIGECYGDYYGVGMNNYMISVFADAETLSGDSIMFEILSDGDGIVGEYPVLDWYAESIYQCFLPGEYEVEDGYLYPYGSWYMTVTGGMMDGTAYAPLVDGDIVITETDGIYTITLDAYDDNGFNISGVLSGVGTIYDEEGNLMQRQKSQPLSGKKAFGRKSMKIGKPLYIK